MIVETALEFLRKGLQLTGPIRALPGHPSEPDESPDDVDRHLPV
jgi:hypothetical protein